MQAAHEIAGLNQALVIAHTITPANLATLPQMIDMAHVLGATRIICDEAMLVGRAWNEREHLLLTDEQRDRVAEVIYIKQDEYHNCMEVLRTSDLADSFALYLHSPCSVLLIRPNGDVKLDCVLPFVIGNVKNQSLTEIWESIGRHAWKHSRVEAFVKNLSGETQLRSLRSQAVCKRRYLHRSLIKCTVGLLPSCFSAGSRYPCPLTPAKTATFCSPNPAFIPRWCI